MTTGRRYGRLGFLAAGAVSIILVGSAVGGPAWAADAAGPAQHGQGAQAKADPANTAHSGGSHEGKPPSPDSTTKPQPPSTADFSEHGANVHGAYDSTRDGSPSENGTGDGEAVGKPCAGCVGKADNKNPPGQLPDGSDSNAGYECDSNSGIGKTNPAHTGCKPAREKPPVKRVTPPGPPPPSEEPPGVTPPAAVPPAAVPPAAVPPGQPRVTLPAGLPKTGATTWLLPVGAGLLLAGTVLIAGSRGRYQRRH